MIKIISKENIELFDGSIIEMKTSNGLADSTNIYVISDTKLTSFEASFDFKDYFKLFNIDNGNVVDRDSITLLNVDYDEQLPLFIYQLNVSYEPLEEEIYNSKLTITINNTTSFNVVFNGYADTLDERLVVTLQNLKKVINDDYMTAFRESVVNTNSTDFELYNRKIREYLINVFEISALQGSYRNLFTVLDYFGYGQLLELREYWVSNGKYKSTPIANQVLNYIDKSLVGFKKTNMLSLTYQINEFDYYDEDGLPVYKNVFEDTDNILVKMRALERILEKEFLAINTHIVDIVGEFRIAIGHDLFMHLNNYNHTELNVTDNLNKPFTFKYVTDNIEILNHKVIVKPWIFEKNPPAITMINNQTSKHQGSFFLIEKVVDETFEDFDMLTKYLSDDFGLLEIDVLIDKTRYQLIEFSIFDSNDGLVFESEPTKIDDIVFDNKILLGIRNDGSYKISFSLIDFYGGRTFFGVPNDVKVSYKEMRVKLGLYGEVGEYSPMTAWSTFPSKDGNHYVPSVVNTNLDVNTWDVETNIPEMIISRMYANDYDMLSTYTTLNNLNAVSLNNLKGIPLYTWSTNYFVSIIDVIRNDDSAGFYIKTNLVDDYIEFNLPSAGSEVDTITELINILNASDLSNEFTFDINYYSDNPSGMISDTRPMLRLKSKEIGYESRYVSILTSNEKYMDFEQHHTKEVVHSFSNIDAKIEFSILRSFVGELKIVLDGHETILNNINIASNEDLQIHLDNLNLDGVYSFTNQQTIIIYSESDIEISHGSFGSQNDIARAKHLKYIKVFPSGTDIQIGKPVFACIDNARKTEMGDIFWTLTDPLTGEIITRQNAFAFRYIFNRLGVYSLKCEFVHNNKDYTFNIDGFVIVVGD